MDKMVWTKWYGILNITDKVTNQSSSHLQYDFFYQSRFHVDAISFPLSAYNLFLTFGYQIYIKFN